jgi:hypothetical protein
MHVTYRAQHKEFSKDYYEGYSATDVLRQMSTMQRQTFLFKFYIDEELVMESVFLQAAQDENNDTYERFSGE